MSNWIWPNAYPDSQRFATLSQGKDRENTGNRSVGPLPNDSSQFLTHPKVRYCLAINLMRISYCKFMTSDVLISSSHPLSSVSNIPFTALSPRPIRSSHPQWNVFGTNLLLRRLARRRRGGRARGGRLFRFGNSWFNQGKTGKLDQLWFIRDLKETLLCRFFNTTTSVGIIRAQRATRLDLS